jgi:hypothetical protein
VTPRQRHRPRRGATDLPDAHNVPFGGGTAAWHSNKIAEHNGGYLKSPLHNSW